MKKTALLIFPCMLAMPFGTAMAQVATRIPLKIVVPYSPGGGSDFLARLLQKPLSDILKQPVLIENKSGAAGTIGTDYVAKAAPDGNTIVLGNQAPNAIVPAFRKTPYDPLNDLRPLTTVAFMPLVLVTSAEKGPKTLKGLLQQGRQPGANLHYGSSGNGSIAHLTGHEFARQGKLMATHIPYQGGGQVIPGLLRGDVGISFMTGADIASLPGKVRILGVTSPKRLATLPDVPAVAEEIPGFTSVVWFAFFAPKGTSNDTAGRLRNAIIKAVEQPEFQKYVTERHGQATTTTPEALTQLVNQDMKVWGEVARAANVSK
jgi:tripartite-type tricarboxylate transporter receptor subunit TctC